MRSIQFTAAAVLATALALPAFADSPNPKPPGGTEMNKKAEPGLGQQNPDRGKLGTGSTAQFNLNDGTEATIKNELDVTAQDAKALVAYREQNGPYESVADLKKVPGLKPDTVERINAMVKYKGAASGAPMDAPKDRGTRDDPGTDPSKTD